MRDMRQVIEIQIILDTDGVKCVRIVGPTEGHASGHELYFRIQDLIKTFDTAIQERLKEATDKVKELSKEKLNA